MRQGFLIAAMLFAGGLAACAPAGPSAPPPPAPTPMPLAPAPAPMPPAPPPRAAAPAPQASSSDGMPDGPGKAETVAACSGCHGLGQIVGEHRTADVWATTVTSMINNGAPVADADFNKVVAYLAAHFGPTP